MDSRSQEEGKKLIDSLEALAEKLVAYVADMSNVPDLKEAVKSSKAKYKDTYWGLGWLYNYFRKRGPIADQLKADLEESGDAKTLLPTLMHFLAQGGTETTSLNTEFLYDLIDKFIQNGEYVDSSARVGMTHGELKRLHELFLKQARALLDQDTPEAIYEKLQTRRTDELKTWSQKNSAPNPSMDEDRKKQLVGAVMTNVLQELVNRAHKQVTTSGNDSDSEDKETVKNNGQMRTLAQLRKEFLDNEAKRKEDEQKKVEQKFAAQQNVGRFDVKEITLTNSDGNEVSLLDHLSSRFGKAPVKKTAAPKKLDLSQFAIAKAFGHDFTQDTVNKKQHTEQEENVQQPQTPVVEKRKGKLDMAKYAHLNAFFGNRDVARKAHEAQFEAKQKHEAEGQQTDDACVVMKSM